MSVNNAQQQVLQDEYTAWHQARRQWAASLRERMRQAYPLTWHEPRKE